MYQRVISHKFRVSPSFPPWIARAPHLRVVPPGGCGIPKNGEITLSHCHILYDATNIYLVGGFNHLEEYESQWEGIPTYYGTIKMFQTTNQFYMMLPTYMLHTLPAQIRTWFN